MRFPTIVRGLCAAAFAAGLCIACQAVAQTDQQSPPRWIADSRTGCKIWDPAPEPHESIHWSGGCKDGFADGNGTLQWFENGRPGDRYVGEYRHGKRNGHGVVTYSNGTRVEGDWSDDQLLQMGVNEIEFRAPRSHSRAAGLTSAA